MKAAVAFIATLVMVATGVLVYHAYKIPEPSATLRTAKVTRGDLLSTISATGTLEPEEVVDVGVQVAGRIKSLGDPDQPHQMTIDYGAVVGEGTVLAKLDDETYKFQLNYAEATLKRAQADLKQAKARLKQSEDDLARANSLRPTRAIADSDFDAIVANHETAKAHVESCQAAIQQNKVLLDIAKENLENTAVKSPVKGTIIDHHASIGRTVQVSPGGPGLFVIAKDLRRMRVCALVNESDIGYIHVGIPVSFTVDAYPDEVFHGKVTQVRLNAAMTQNSVTYTAVVSADNPDGKLLPHLTARLRFELDQKRNILLVPSMALRWRPKVQQLPTNGQKTFVASAGDDATVRDLANASLVSDNKGVTGVVRGRDENCSLWVDEGRFVRPIKVRAGASDGTMTEVSGNELHEGMEVVVGDSSSEESEEGRSSALKTADPVESKRVRSEAALLSYRVDKRHLTP